MTTEGMYNNTRLMVLLICSKVVIALAILVNALLPPHYNWGALWANFNSMTHNSSWAIYFKTWDANQFLFLSQHGYVPGSAANAMYPLWPFIIRLGRYIFQDELLAGVVLSNVFSVCAFWVMFRLVAARYGDKTAMTAVILLLAFPGSFFYCFAYSESLFTFLAVSFFAAIQQRRYGIAALLAFLCPLTKAVGVFIILPFCYAIWEEWRAKKVSLSHFLLLLCPIGGYVTVMGIMYLFTGDPLAHFVAQSSYIANPSVSAIFQPLQLVQKFFSVQPGHTFLYSPFDRLWFLLALAGLYLIFRVDLKMLLFAVPVTIIPAVTTSFMSYTRYTAVIFPLFIGYGIHFSRERWRWAFWVTVSILVVIQLYFLMLHINYYWVA